MDYSDNIWICSHRYSDKPFLMFLRGCHVCSLLVSASSLGLVRALLTFQWPYISCAHLPGVFFPAHSAWTIWMPLPHSLCSGLKRKEKKKLLKYLYTIDRRTENTKTKNATDYHVNKALNL